MTLPELRSILSGYNPRLTKDLGPTIYRWESEGADMGKDILPVIRNWIDRKPGIYSLRFFEPYVLKARDARLEAERPLASADDRKLAARIAFATRVVGKCLPREEAWLARFEGEHGAIELPSTTKPKMSAQTKEGERA